MFSADHIPLYYKNTYEATLLQDTRVLGNVWVYARPTRPFKTADHHGYVLVENPVGVGGWDPCIGRRCELKKVKRDEEEY